MSGRRLYSDIFEVLINPATQAWNETLTLIKQLWGMHRNLKNNVKPRTWPSFRTVRSVKGLGIKLNSRVLRMWRRVANVELSI